jgi:BirA family biotin operon repressor/biotin-[acetyl-CoA-carboxylase] ligase
MIRWVDRLHSTMDAAAELAAAGAAHGTAVAAREQTGGRGRHGRVWDSPPGGLWVSVVCRPDGTPAIAHASVRVGLEVAAAIEATLPGLPRLELKLPNDLLLGGRKVGGILCEARWEGSRLVSFIVGVGINVRNPIPPDLIAVATTLAEWVPDPNPEDLAEPVRQAVANGAARSGPLTADELAAVTARNPLRASTGT